MTCGFESLIEMQYFIFETGQCVRVLQATKNKSKISPVASSNVSFNSWSEEYSNNRLLCNNTKTK